MTGLRPGCIAVVAGALVTTGCARYEEMTVTATAYNSTRAQTDSRPHLAAWGDRIEPGMQIIAVSPDLLKAGLDRGTEVRIEGLDGKWRVLDRTASRHRNRIDIYMGKDVAAAREWGIKEVTIRWRE